MVLFFPYQVDVPMRRWPLMNYSGVAPDDPDEQNLLQVLKLRA